MANTRQIPLKERPDEGLLEDLCIELRHVGVGDSGLPDNVRVVEHIHQVNAIHAELVRRDVDDRSRLELLSKETAWRIQELLEDCLAFPRKMPYVREQDGIRRTLRCRACGKGERPPDAKILVLRRLHGSCCGCDSQSCPMCGHNLDTHLYTRVPLRSCGWRYSLGDGWQPRFSSLRSV